jgi:Tlde1 domain
MWTYAQQTGQLLRNGQCVGKGYSGRDEGRNNPELQADPGIGPIPQGDWTIVGPPKNTSRHGPYVLTLAPSADTNTFGRSGFLMHGDSIEAPGTASKGCIVMPRNVREQIWISGDTDLEVVAEFATQDLLQEEKA